MAARDEDAPKTLEEALLRLEQVEEEREAELSEQIETVEALAALEEAFQREKADHAAASAALLEQVKLRRKAEEARAKLERYISTLNEEHDKDVASLRKLHSEEIEAMAQEIRRMERVHNEEVMVLRAKVTDLKNEVAGLVWTERHREEAACMSPEELFKSILVSQSAVATEGLAQRLGSVLSEHRDLLSWVEESGWVERLSRQVEETRAGGVSVDACAALSRIPELVHRIVTSGLLTCLADVLSLDSQADTQSNDGDAVPPSRFRRTAQERTHIHQAIATTLLNCLTTNAVLHTPVEMLRAFASAPRALACLAMLTSHECEADPQATDPDILHTCARAFEILCSNVQLQEGLFEALVKCGAIKALQLMLSQPRVYDQALRALTDCANDVTACEAIVQIGAVVPCVDLLRQQLAQLKGSSTDTGQTASRVVSLMVQLSRASNFAAVLIATEGHTVLADMTEYLPEGVRAHAAEVLVNVMFLNPDLAGQMAGTKALKCVLGLIAKAPEDAPAALSRTCDVLSQLLIKQPKLAAKIDLASLSALAQLVTKNKKLFAYKVAHFFHAYVKSSEAAVPYLSNATVLDTVLSLSATPSSEVQTWMLEVLQFLVMRSRGLPPQVAVQKAQRKQVARALCALQDRGRNPAIRAQAAVAYFNFVFLVWQLAEEQEAAQFADDVKRVQQAVSLINAVPLADPESLARVFADVAECAGIRDLVFQSGSVLLKLLETKLTGVQELVDEIISAAWQPPVDVARLCDLDLLRVLVQAANALDNSKAAERIMQLAEDDEQEFGVKLVEAEGVGVVAKTMRASNEQFHQGSRIIASLLKNEAVATETLHQAGLGLILDILRSTPDEGIQRVIADRLPPLFEEESVCIKMASTGLMSHLVAVVDTVPSQLELETALVLLEKMIVWPRSAVSLVRHGGFRVLVDVALMEEFAGPSLSGGPMDAMLLSEPFEFVDMPGDEPTLTGPAAVSHNGPRASTVLQKLLEMGEEITKAIAEEGGVSLLVVLVEQSESDVLVSLAVSKLLDLSTTNVANEMVRSGAALALAKVFRRVGPVPGAPAQPESAAYRAAAALVNLAWNVQSMSKRGNQQETLTTLVEEGALPSWAYFAGLPDCEDDVVMELKRAALWAMSTWLSYDDVKAKYDFVRGGFMRPLLEVEEECKVVELSRYARLGLSRLLCAMGDELSCRILVVRAQMRQAEDVDQFWAQLAEPFLQLPPSAFVQQSQDVDDKENTDDRTEAQPTSGAAAIAEVVAHLGSEDSHGASSAADPLAVPEDAPNQDMAQGEHGSSVQPNISEQLD